MVISCFEWKKVPWRQANSDVTEKLKCLDKHSEIEISPIAWPQEPCKPAMFEGRSKEPRLREPGAEVHHHPEKSRCGAVTHLLQIVAEYTDGRNYFLVLISEIKIFKIYVQTEAHLKESAPEFKLNWTNSQRLLNSKSFHSGDTQEGKLNYHFLGFLFVTL